MLDSTALTKALFTRLEKATAAIQPKELSEGRPQNPLASVHWTMENHGAGYRITMMRSGLVIAQKAVTRAELADQESVDGIVTAMFEKVPAPKAA